MKATCAKVNGYDDLSPDVKEALDMITKMRVLYGYASIALFRLFVGSDTTVPDEVRKILEGDAPFFGVSFTLRFLPFGYCFMKKYPFHYRFITREEGRDALKPPVHVALDYIA